MKYDNNGLDTTHLSAHFNSLIRNLIKSNFQSFAKVSQDGFYVVDANGNIGLKYDENGLSCALVESIPNYNSSKKELMILFIGNSFSIDNCVYLPRLLESNPEISFTIGVLFLSGRTISQHISDFNNDVPYVYYEYKSANGCWRSSGGENTTIKNALDNGFKWDIILTHEASSYCTNRDRIINDSNGL